MTELGDLLRKLRGDESLRDAAKRSGVSHNYLSIIEKGVDPRSGSPVKPSPDTLRALSKAYNYEYEELMKLAGYLPETENGPVVAESSATYQTVNYDELFKKISKEFNLDLQTPEDQQKLIDALHIVIKIHGALNK